MTESSRLLSPDVVICDNTGKQRYATEDAATEALEQVRLKRKAGQKRHRRIYECNGCGGWHLTSRKRWKP